MQEECFEEELDEGEGGVVCEGVRPDLGGLELLFVEELVGGGGEGVEAAEELAEFAVVGGVFVEFEAFWGWGL